MESRVAWAATVSDLSGWLPDVSHMCSRSQYARQAGDQLQPTDISQDMRNSIPMHLLPAFGDINHSERRWNKCVQMNSPTQPSQSASQLTISPHPVEVQSSN